VSPGSAIESASSLDTSPSIRSTAPPAAGVDEVAERSLDRVERDEATRPFA